MADWKYVTEKEFTTIKTLIDAGLTNKQIHEITQRSTGTISNIGRADNLADYKAKNRVYWDKKTKEASTAQGVGTDTVEVDPIVPKDDRVVYHEQLVAALDKIAATLDRLVDAWESTPKRRRLL